MSETPPGMTDSEDKIHVMPVAPNDWEIEAQSGDAVAHEPDRETAIAVALDVAREEGIETVIVHDGDGVTEELHSAYRRANAEPRNGTGELPAENSP